MEIQIHEVNNTQVAEVVATGIAINNADDALDAIGNIMFGGVDKMILHAVNITPAFFDLKTGIAGDVLQKFTNYRVRLAIVGDVSTYNSNSLRDFVFESNKGRQVNFVDTKEDALDRLAG